MQDKKNYLTIGEASEYLGVSIDTLRRWEKKGRITPYRSPGGHRYYEKEELDNLFGKRYTRDEPTASHTGQTSPLSEPQVTPVHTTFQSLPSSDEEDNIFGSTSSYPSNPDAALSLPSLTPSFVEKEHIPREIRLRPLEPVRITRQVVASARVEVVELPSEPEMQEEIIESFTATAVKTQIESQVPGVAPTFDQPLLNPRPEVLIPQVSFKSDTPLPAEASAKQIPSSHTLKTNKKELATTVVIISILILVTILGVVLFFMLWESSQSVLSPTP